MNAYEEVKAALMIKYMGLTQMVSAMSAKIGSKTLAVAVLDATCVKTAVNVQIVRLIAHGGRLDKTIILATIHLKSYSFLLEYFSKYHRLLFFLLS